MRLFSKQMVANSELIKNYKSSRAIAEGFGKIFVLKNNQPDAVLFSIDEYERVSVFIEYMESLDEKEMAALAKTLPKKRSRRTYSIENFKSDIKDTGAIDMSM
jgi:PHD/YefM family antitoxin component YafN of YafNO toxin-antitoxin module